MTPLELLEVARERDIVLKVEGDRLLLRAPASAITDELRAALSTHKFALLAFLGPERFVTLKGGLTLPVAPILLALDLEARGVALSVEANHELRPSGDPRLTPADLQAIRRWRAYLAAFVEYRVPESDQPL